MPPSSTPLYETLDYSCEKLCSLFLIQSKKNHLRGSHQTANEFSNCALALTVATIVSGLMGLILGLGIVFALVYQPCKFGLVLSKFITCFLKIILPFTCVVHACYGRLWQPSHLSVVSCPDHHEK